MLFKRFIIIPSLVLFLSVFLFAGMGYFLFDIKVKSAERNLQLKASATELINQVQFLRRQQALYLQYGSEYKAILATGLAQDFDRVRWVDEMLQIKKELVAIPFVMQFEPERKIESEQFSFYSFTRDIFYYTRMNLDASFQTDHDLVLLNEMISTRISPLFALESCQVSIDKDALSDLQFDPDEGGFQTRCSFIIFQAKPRLLVND